MMADDTTVYNNVKDLIDRSDQLIHSRINMTNDEITKTLNAMGTLQKFVDESKVSLYKEIEIKERDSKESDQLIRKDIESLDNRERLDKEQLEKEMNANKELFDHRIEGTQNKLETQIGNLDERVNLAAKITAVNDIESSLRGTIKTEDEKLILEMNELKANNLVALNSLDLKAKGTKEHFDIEIYSLKEKLDRAAKITAMNDMESRLSRKIRKDNEKLNEQLEQYSSQVATLKQELSVSYADSKSTQNQLDTLQWALIYAACGLGGLVLLISIVVTIIVKKRKHMPKTPTRSLNDHVVSAF